MRKVIIHFLFVFVLSAHCKDLATDQTRHTKARSGKVISDWGQDESHDKSAENLLVHNVIDKFFDRLRIVPHDCVGSLDCTTLQKPGHLATPVQHSSLIPASFLSTARAYRCCHYQPAPWSSAGLPWSGYQPVQSHNLPVPKLAAVPGFARNPLDAFGKKAESSRAGVITRLGWFDDDDDEDITIARVQIALFGKVREFQAQLDDIANNAQTDTLEGLHKVLTDVVSMLLRNREYFESGFAYSGTVRDPERAEELYNEYSLQERTKFEAETLSNVGGVARSGSTKAGTDEKGKEYLLVTIILAYGSKFKLESPRSLSDATDILQKLGSTIPSRLDAVEVIWNPQEQGDILTANDLMVNYPELRTFR
eukprot:gnl/MRDRNA2_/MRDRNA2_98326_c0_seq1.p1 gnl/MRDRNA2_/MRDRNA2_98326_c0~~gnl/MRDRNA2_/MRDRNA2_98326_c0_seq1.p1  ORF type:complete len:366 (-),score=70.88 gnl/MRDRNA2_/MRDRNA2_98326_c0_seq1:277-1374(-)